MSSGDNSKKKDEKITADQLPWTDIDTRVKGIWKTTQEALKDAPEQIKAEQLPWTDIDTRIKDAFDAHIKTAQEAISSAQEAIKDTSDQIKNLPLFLRNKAVYAAKLVAANVQVVGDVIADASDVKNPPVTSERGKIIKFLQDKQPELLQKMQELGEKIKDLPPEKRAVLVVKFANEQKSKVGGEETS